MKTRNHNEYFRTVSMGNRKSCPTCKAKLAINASIWSWGEYHNGKWNTIAYFCRECFASNVRNRLTSHTNDCGCIVSLVGYRGEQLPLWLTLNTSLSEV